MTATPRTVAAFLLLVAGSSPARAGEPWSSNHGFEIGFRTGVSVPAGDIEPGWTLSSQRGLQFPLWVDLGYRIGPVVMGGYGVWAPGLLQGWDLARFGLGVDFALSPSLKLGPFIHATVSQFVKFDHSSGYPNTDWFIDKSLHSWITIGVKLTNLP